MKKILYHLYVLVVTALCSAVLNTANHFTLKREDNDNQEIFTKEENILNSILKYKKTTAVRDKASKTYEASKTKCGAFRNVIVGEYCSGEAAKAVFTELQSQYIPGGTIKKAKTPPSSP